ncbi:ABC transporter permease [Leucobacter sp. M11]|uniref:ABC transporter permease n=1 Tax=Leucobacter sp. M11 TaxID=2993565 RepID=UPI002D80B194|nr:ABC transporter permease [Leucobacter sp. M11]
MTATTVVRKVHTVTSVTRAIHLKGKEKPPRGAFGLMLPGLIAVALLALAPLFIVARNSFAVADNYGGITGGFTLDNYAKLLDPVYSKTFLFSIGLALLNTVICLVIGYLTSYYIVSRPEGKQGFLLLLVIIPFWTDFLVRTFAWITILGSGGPLAGVLGIFGISGFSLIPSNVAVFLGLLYSFLPTAIFPIYASMRSIDGSLKEAATDLGCSWWGVHRRVILPLSKPGILGAALLTFIPTMGVFVIPVLLGGGKDPLIGNVIVTLYTEFRNQPMGAAVSMVLLVLMFISMALIGLALRKPKPKGA